MSRWGGAIVEVSSKVFWDGEASDEASRCESKKQPRGVPEWKS